MRWLWIAVLLAVACGKQKQGEPDDWTAPPVMEEGEQQRGKMACETYVERLCACADTNESLQEQCRLARQQPEALRQLLGMLNGEEGKFGKREIREAQHTARRIIKDCFEKEAALDPTVCPRR